MYALGTDGASSDVSLDAALALVSESPADLAVARAPGGASCRRTDGHCSLDILCHCATDLSVTPVRPPRLPPAGRPARTRSVRRWAATTAAAPLVLCRRHSNAQRPLLLTARRDQGHVPRRLPAPPGSPRLCAGPSLRHHHLGGRRRQPAPGCSWASLVRLLHFFHRSRRGDRLAGGLPVRSSACAVRSVRHDHSPVCGDCSGRDRLGSCGSGHHLCSDDTDRPLD